METAMFLEYTSVLIENRR